MANEQNLIPQQHKLTVEEQSKGGKKSVKSKKEKKYIKNLFEQLLSLELKDNTLKEKIKSLGVPEDEITIQMALCVSITNRALQGNLKAFEIIQNSTGQNWKEGTQTEHIDNLIFINDIPTKLKEKKEVDKKEEKL